MLLATNNQNEDETRYQQKSRMDVFFLLKFLPFLFAYQLVFIQQSTAQQKNELTSFVQRLKDTLRIADSQLDGAVLAFKNGEQNTFRNKHRKATTICLSVMEQIKMYMYIQVQRNSGGLNVQHNTDLKKLDDILYQAEKIFRRGIEFLFKLLHSDQTENELLELIEQYPHNQFIRQYLINCYEQQKRWKDVIEQGEKLLTQYSESKQIHFSIGHAYEAIGIPSKAIVSYIRALEIDNQDSTMYEILNRLYQNESLITEWIDYLKHQQRLHPHNNLIKQYLQKAVQSLEK